MKRFNAFFILFSLTFTLLFSQSWSTITLGTMGDYSPMIVSDNDGYIHFGNASLYGNTCAIDPNTTSGLLAWHSTALPHFDGSYFPAMRMQDNKPHMAFRTYGGGTEMGVLYWTPEFGADNWEVYFDWHGHYPSLEVDGTGTRHIWYQVDGYGDNGQETNIIYTNSNDGATQRMVPDTLDRRGLGGLYDYTTVIDKENNFHWLGAVFNQKAGPGRKLYYNHSIAGVFQEAQRLPWDGAFPSMAVDQNNIVHAVWQNGDIQYSHNDGSGWSDAEIVNTPGDSLQKWVVWQQVSDDNLQAMRPIKGHLNWAWACGNWGIFMTDNNWESYDIQYVDGNGHLGIYPVDSITVYSVGTGGRYWKTVNGGLVYPNGDDGWTEYSTGYTQDLYDCWFHDELTGFAVGDDGLIIKTTNGGSSWTTITSGVSAILRSIDFPTPDIGYIAGRAGKVLKTTDGGDSWTVLTTGTTRNLWDVCAINADTLWIAGGTATVKVSYDGGSNWTTKNNGASAYLSMGYTIHFFNNDVGYLAGTSTDINNEQKIFKTIDGGNTWEATTPLAGQTDTAPIRGLYTISENTVFAAGGTGKVFKGVKSTDAAYMFPGIAIDQNGYAHVAYWGWINSGWDRAIYYNNNISGTWGEHQQVAQSAYLAQTDGGSRIAFDYKTNTIYIGGLSVLEGKLFYTRDINICAPSDKDQTTIVTASSALTEPNYLHVSNVGEANAVSVFDFTITDIGDDGLSTFITDLNIRKGPEATSALLYDDALGGCRLFWESDSCDASRIGLDVITFGDSTSNLVEITEGGSITFTLKSWLGSLEDISDGNSFDFKISAAHDIHVDSIGTLMSNVPSDITSGAITFQLVPTELIISGLPESIWFGTDFSFLGNFIVTAVDDSGNTVVTAACSDLSLTPVATDGVSPALGTLAVSPSSPPVFVDGVATYNSLNFSDAHQLVRIQASGTINGEVITGLSDTVKIIPYVDQIIIDGNQRTALPNALDRLGLNYDTHFGWYGDGLPEGILDDYKIVFIASSVDKDDFVAVKHFLDSGSPGDEKSLGFFCGNTGYFTGTTPWATILAPYAGIGVPTLYPSGELDPTENDTLYGIANDAIGNGLAINYSPNAISWDNTALTPATDSTNIRAAFETTMKDVGYYHDSYDFRVPNALRHNGTNYKVFTSGFYLDYFGSDSDKDTLLQRVITWFESEQVENYGHAPGFSTSLTAEADDRYTVNDLDTMTYTAKFFDLDPFDVLTPSVVVSPIWLDCVDHGDSLCFSGIPQVSDVGDTMLVIRIADELGNYAIQTTRIRITHVNHSPQILSAPLNTAYAGTLYEDHVVGFDPDTLEGDVLSYSLLIRSFSATSGTPAKSAVSPSFTSIPPGEWLSLSEQGLLSGTPQTSDIGLLSGTLIVADNFALRDSLDFTINVLPGVNHAPVADTLHLSTPEDFAASFTLTATDADDDTLTYTVVLLPENGSLSGTAPDLTYTPNEDWFGEDSLLFIANDGELNSDSTAVWIIVTSSDDHIQVSSLLPTSFTLEITESDTVHFAITAEDPDGFPLEYNWQIDSTVVSTDASFDLITDYLGDYDAGTYVVTLNIDDNYASGGIQRAPSHTLDYLWTVTVLNHNRPPVTNDPFVEMNEDSSVTIALDVSDPDQDNLSFTQLSAGRHGSVSGSWPTVSYTPELNWFGRDTLACIVSDGELDDTADVHILVRPVNDPPAAVTLLTPGNTFAVVLTPDTMSDTLRFSWTEPNDVDHDNLHVAMIFSAGMDAMATVDLHESQNSAWITYQYLSTLLDTVSGISGSWDVMIHDDTDSTLSTNGAFELSVDNFAMVSIAKQAYLPCEFVLYQNYPNPFNPLTLIRFDLPAANHVTLTLYNMLGREAATLINEYKDAGNYELTLDASNLPTGTYFYSISAGAFHDVKKMVLIK